MSSQSQIKRDTTVVKTYKMHMESKTPKYQVPFKKDSIILYNQFRDYVGWIEEQEKKKQK